MAKTTSYVSLAGRPIRHLAGTETVEDILEDVDQTHTCHTAQRAWARRLITEAANSRYSTPVYKARTTRSLVDDISVVYLDFLEDADEAILKRIDAEANERISKFLEYH